MKRKLFGIAGVLAIVLGIVLGGCGTLDLIKFSRPVETETETSKMLLDAANDVILAKDDGIAPAAFQVAFERRIQGVKITGSGGRNGNGSAENLNPNYPSVWISYKDKQYRMTFTGRGAAAKTSSGLYTDTWTYITSAKKCVEIEAAE
jgi:hypothetical protein